MTFGLAAKIEGCFSDFRVVAIVVAALGAAAAPVAGQSSDFQVVGLIEGPQAGIQQLHFVDPSTGATYRVGPGVDLNAFYANTAVHAGQRRLYVETIFANTRDHEIVGISLDTGAEVSRTAAPGPFYGVMDEVTGSLIGLAPDENDAWQIAALDPVSGRLERRGDGVSFSSFDNLLIDDSARRLHARSLDEDGRFGVVTIDLDSGAEVNRLQFERPLIGLPDIVDRTNHVLVGLMQAADGDALQLTTVDPLSGAIESRGPGLDSGFVSSMYLDAERQRLFVQTHDEDGDYGFVALSTQSGAELSRVRFVGPIGGMGHSVRRRLAPIDRIGRLESLVDQLAVTDRVRRALVKDLERLRQRLEAGRTSQACNALRQFSSGVERLRGGDLSEADATRLLDEVQGLRSALACS